MHATLLLRAIFHTMPLAREEKFWFKILIQSSPSRTFQEQQQLEVSTVPRGVRVVAEEVFFDDAGVGVDADVDDDPQLVSWFVLSRSGASYLCSCIFKLRAKSKCLLLYRLVLAMTKIVTNYGGASNSFH